MITAITNDTRGDKNGVCRVEHCTALAIKKLLYYI